LLVGLPAVQDLLLGAKHLLGEASSRWLGSSSGGQLKADPYCNAVSWIALCGRGFNQYSCLREL
jgi:hypothetical protein